VGVVVAVVLVVEVEEVEAGKAAPPCRCRSETARVAVGRVALGKEDCQKEDCPNATASAAAQEERQEWVMRLLLSRFTLTPSPPKEVCQYLLVQVQAEVEVRRLALLLL
jgi:hypothetical protein